MRRSSHARSFLKGGGALIIGFSVAGAAFAGKASAKFPATPPTPAGFNPDLNQVDSWITINADETVVLKTSQIEVGNGITTGFLQVLAEELDADMSQMRYGMFNQASHTVVDTWVAGSTGGEGGSNAMSGTGPKVRNVGALARQALLGLASTSLGVPAANLTIDKGVISGGGKSVSFGQLVGGKLLNVKGANTALQPGVAPAKPFSAYKTVLKDPNPVTRIDIPDKVSGKYTYVHQVRVPGMLHGRMVRPRGQGAYPYNSNVPVSIDAIVDLPYSGRSGRAREQLRRCCCAEGVRRDPGGCSAEGGVEHEPDPSRERATCGSTTATWTPRGRSLQQLGARRRATWTLPWLRRRTRCRGASLITTRVICRSARAVRSPMSLRRVRRSGATRRTCTA